MPESVTNEPLDQLRRAELAAEPGAVADTLDGWLLRAHGIVSGSHNVGLFLDLLADHGLAITSSSTVAPTVGPTEADKALARVRTALRERRLRARAPHDKPSDQPTGPWVVRIEDLRAAIQHQPAAVPQPRGGS